MQLNFEWMKFWQKLADLIFYFDKNPCCRSTRLIMVTKTKQSKLF